MRIHRKIEGYLRFRIFTRDDHAAAIDSDGDEVLTLKDDAAPSIDTGFNKQIITDAFFERWLSGTGDKNRSELFRYMGVGTGTAAATAADTTITQLGTRMSIFPAACTISAVSPKIIQTLQFRSTQGQYIGTISECAIFEELTGGQTMMRSLIKDSGGTPVALPLGAMDFLYVDWKTETTINLSDVDSVVNIAGRGDYNCKLRPMFWNDLDSTPSESSGNIFAAVARNTRAGNAFGFSAMRAFTSQTLTAINSGPSGSFDSSTQRILDPYVPNSKQRAVTYIADVSKFNTAGGFGSIAIYEFVQSGMRSAGYQISFSRVSDGAKVLKDNTFEFRIKITYSFSR